MRDVSEQEIDFILNDISNKGIVIEDVKYNILDHLCCMIENEMPEDANFKEFYENTIAKFYKNELSEIEYETRELITFKYFYAMKRTLKISGIIAIILIMIGVTFKSMHWPGAGVAIVLGLAFFSLIFIPLNIVMKFKDDKLKSNRLIMTVGMITAAAACIGVLFKIMHWPYANVLMVSSLVVFMLIFIPIYFVVRFKDPDTKFNAIIHTTFMVGAAGMLFALVNLGHSKNKEDKLRDQIRQEVIQELDQSQSNQ